MTDRPMAPSEHYAEAQRLLEAAVLAEAGSHAESYALAAAQVHATLASARPDPVDETRARLFERLVSHDTGHAPDRTHTFMYGDLTMHVTPEEAALLVATRTEVPAHLVDVVRRATTDAGVFMPSHHDATPPGALLVTDGHRVYALTMHALGH